LTVSISFWPYHEPGDLADKIENAGNYSAVVAAAIHGYRFK
jgi:hypothetical protein